MKIKPLILLRENSWTVWIHLRSWSAWLGAFLLSFVHPYTIGRFLAVMAKGLASSATGLSRYVRAADLPELREKNPTKHAEEAKGRRGVVAVVAVLDLLLLLGAVVLAGRKFELPPAWGLVAWSGVHLVIVFLIGRTERVRHTITTQTISPEAMIKEVVDQITLTTAQRKEGHKATMVRLAHRVNDPDGNPVGTEAFVKVAQVGEPAKLLGIDGVDRVAHKVPRKGPRQVFTYQMPDSSVIRILLLDRDPKEMPATVNDVVRRPREVDLWAEDVSWGTWPDRTSYGVRMTEEGGGFQILAGGSPRQGKTSFLSLLISVILMHRHSKLYLVDGKAVDFDPVAGLCEVFVGGEDAAGESISNHQVMLRATEVLEGLQEEMYARRKIISKTAAGHITKELNESGMPLLWFVLDEIAVITEDLLSIDKPGVERFLEVLGNVVRLGPAFGIRVIIATQRPSEKSIPPALRGMFLTRVSFRVGDPTAAKMVLGSGGPDARSDKLDEDDKGAAIIAGRGQIKMHLTTKADLKRVAAFVAQMRGTNLDGGSVEMVYPARVAEVLRAFHYFGSPAAVRTPDLIEELSRVGIIYTAESLAAALKPFGVSPGRARLAGDAQFRGYKLADLEAVPKVAVSRLSDTDESGTETAARLRPDGDS